MYDFRLVVRGEFLSECWNFQSQAWEPRTDDSTRANCFAPSNEFDLRFPSGVEGREWSIIAVVYPAVEESEEE